MSHGLAHPIKSLIAAVLGTTPPAVTDGQMIFAKSNLHGLQYVLYGHPKVVTFPATYTTAQTDTTLITPAGGKQIVIIHFGVYLSKNCTVNCAAKIMHGSTILFRHPGIAPGSGVCTPCFKRGAVDAAIKFTCEVPTTDELDLQIDYFEE